MKKRFFNNGIWVLCTALLLSAALGVGSVLAPGITTPVTEVMGVVSYPFRHISAKITQGKDAAAGFFGSKKALEEENARLREELSRLQAEQAHSREAVEENARLRELLRLKRAGADYQWEPAQVTGRCLTGWTRTLTLNKGSECALETGMCVITQSGHLVGVITQTGQGWSEVTTLLDPTFTVGVRTRSGEYCLLTGGLDGVCTLRSLNGAGAFLLGETVFTSGLGNSYPPGLIAGEVTGAEADPSGMECRGEVTSLLELEKLKELFVIRDFSVVD